MGNIINLIQWIDRYISSLGYVGSMGELSFGYGDSGTVNYVV